MRPIETSGFAAITRPESLGPAPELRWLPIDQLVVDDTYQRGIINQGRKNIRQIAESFSWTFFAPVIVSPIEGGRYAVIDGQHRTTAAALIGVKEVPCALVIADARQQAMAFRAINGQVTRLLKTQLFHARLAAGDDTAKRTAAMCEAAGVTIPRWPGGWKEKLTYTTAVDAVVRMAENHLRAGTLTLKCLATASLASDAACLRATVITALFNVLEERQQWRANEAFLISVFETLPVAEMLTHARSAALQIRGTSPADQLQAAFIDALEQRFARAAAA